MQRMTMLWEVFVARFEEAFEQYQRHRLTGEEAGEPLGMSGRNFRRLCVRYGEDGIEGLRDRRIGKVSPRRPSTLRVRCLPSAAFLLRILDRRAAVLRCSRNHRRLSAVQKNQHGQSRNSSKQASKTSASLTSATVL